MKQYDETNLKAKHPKVGEPGIMPGLLSYVYMPHGMGLRLGLKDYQVEGLVENALIGEEDKKRVVIPYAHTERWFLYRDKTGMGK